MSEKLSLTLSGKRYDISLEGIHPRVKAECAWLTTESTLTAKDLLRAYLEKCQESAQIHEMLENLEQKLDRNTRSS